MQKTAIVIGAGLAGATTAFALRKAGIKVVVLEKGAGPAMGASANPMCIMYPRFDAQWNKYTNFYLEAYKYGLQFYRDYPQHFIQSGVLAFARDDQKQKFSTIAKMLGPDICQLDGDNEFGLGLLLSRSGYLHTKDICQFLLRDMEVKYNAGAVLLQRDASGEWRVLNHQGEVIAVAEHVVLANGCDAGDIIPAIKKAVYTVRGQSSFAAADIGYSSEHVLCFPCISVTPSVNGVHHFGATYDRDNSCLEISDASHQKNLANLAEYFPEAGNLAVGDLNGTAGNRCFTKDYLPIVGEVPGCSGVYLNISHGSRGVVSAPIAADFLVKMMHFRFSDKLTDILSPKRFINDR